MSTVHKSTLPTERQRDILDFIRACQEENGVTPSIEEIRKHFHLSSSTGVRGHLAALEKKGLIKRDPAKARSVVIQGESVPKNLVNFPIYGSIAAGLPTDEVQQSLGSVAVDSDLLRISRGARVFALQVRGESMINAGILDGDTALMAARESKNQDIVAALIDGETTLKRLVLRAGKPFLKAENPMFKDLIPAHELVIQGVMIGLFRMLK